MTKHFFFFIFFYEFVHPLQNLSNKKFNKQLVLATDWSHNKILKRNSAIIGEVMGNVYFPDHLVSSAELKVRGFLISVVLPFGLRAELIIIRSNLRSDARSDSRSDLKSNLRPTQDQI